ncbi:hypothetical protein glysoja_047210 [Glycine soja]|uniref:Uncharacterized protein n=1 Tax=Glycine soja TaxID=3848 RepID=A0A0B2PVJ2_GLYSO|nr:hypothetical protein glysoja_047210 [Glycine soja]
MSKAVYLASVSRAFFMVICGPILFLWSLLRGDLQQMESLEPDVADCLDGCTTGCVQNDSRLQARCEGKCSIRYGPRSLFSIDLWLRIHSLSDMV